MHVAASLIAVAMDPPSVIAAAAMAVPTIARISAYSAAEAPDSSVRKVLRKVFMVNYPIFRTIRPLASMPAEKRVPASISG